MEKKLLLTSNMDLLTADALLHYLRSVLFLAPVTVAVVISVLVLDVDFTSDE